MCVQLLKVGAGLYLKCLGLEFGTFHHIYNLQKHIFYFEVDFVF